MLRFAAAACLLALAGPALAQGPISVPALTYTHRELANGLDVYAMPDASAGTVTVTAWYDVGGKDDPQGRSGFAHLFEHILSRKTVNLPYGQISTMVENAGGSRNASTGQDFTNYYETVPPEYLETMLWTHAERMARPVVDQAVFDAERSIVKEELRQRVYAPPYGRLQWFVIGDNSYDDSVYRRGIIGSIEQLDSATIDDARAFHEAYYRPANATLVISGNFDPAELDRLVDRYFGQITNPDRPTPVFERPVETPRTQPRLVEAYAPNVPLPAVATIYPGPSASHADTAALEVMAAILSRGQNSRLYQALVYRAQLATSASLSLNALEEDGVITANVTVAQGKSIADTEAALAAELTRIREQPVTAQELAEAKTELVTSELRERETPSGRAFILGQALASQNDPGAPDARLAAIQAVAVEDVQRVARTWLVDQARVQVRYQDESARPATVAADGWRNPAPTPVFLTVPPAVLPPNELLPEDQRMAPPPLGQARPMAVPQVAERRLANGLRVIAAKSTDLPIMTAQLVMGGGAAADPDAKAGLAAMTASLATQGAGGRSAPEIAATLERLGAEIGANASADASILSVSMPVGSAAAAGSVLADVVMRPAFDDVELARSRTRAINGVRVNLRQPGPLAAAVLNRVAYGGAAYGRPATGTPESLAMLTREDLTEFHRRWWRPDNATLIITGGLEPEAALAFAEETLGGWRAPADALPVVAHRAGETVQRPRVVVVDLPGAGQAAVTAAVRAPLRADEGWYPLAVANAVMGAGQNGRLFQEIRAKRGLSYGASSGLGARVDGGLLVASTQTKNESAAEVVDLVLAEFDRLAVEPVEPAEIANRASFINGGRARSLETTGGLGGVLAEATIHGLPLDEITAYPTRISATTPASLAEAARRVDADQAYVVVVGQADQFVDKLRETHPDLVVIPADQLDLDSPTLGIAGAQPGGA